MCVSDGFACTSTQFARLMNGACLLLVRCEMDDAYATLLCSYARRTVTWTICRRCHEVQTQEERETAADEVLRTHPPQSGRSRRAA